MFKNYVGTIGLGLVVGVVSDQSDSLKSSYMVLLIVHVHWN